MGISIDVAKTAANGHWATIANRVIGISDDYLSKKHGPCPKCGGDTRFRIFDDFEQTGGMVCSHCGKFGDGFSAAQWFLGIPFFEAIEKICAFLGVVDDKPKKKSKTKKKEPPQAAKLEGARPENSEVKEDDIESLKEKQELEFIDWKSKLFSQWASTKKPITEEGVKLAGGQFARYRNMTVIAIPIIGRDGKPNGHAIYNATGGTIPYRPKGSKIFEQLKVKLVGVGNASGWIGRFLPGVETIKAEGVSDTLALLSANQSGSVICNPFGAGEDPLAKHRQWMLEQLRNQIVFTIHDCDQPGVDGATWVTNGARSRPGWSPVIAIISKESRNVRLPYEIEEKHGKDSRDFLNEQIESGKTIEEAYESLMVIARAAEVIEKPDGYVVDTTQEEEPARDGPNRSEKDPRRLARLNVDTYESLYNGRLVYWRDEWWKWKRDRYKNINAKELRAKLSELIAIEFDRLWEIENKQYEEKKKSPDYDPDSDKGPPKVREIHPGLLLATMMQMESICRISGDIDLQTWIDGREKKQYLAVQNGIIDIEAYAADEDEIILEHSSNWFSTSCLSYPFDPNANCDKWLEFIDFAMESDDKKIAVVQEFMGYLLLPSTKFQKFLAVEGDGGNGKSVFFAVVEAVIGVDNISNVRLEKFKGQFDLGETIGKMANMCGETFEIDPTGESILKQFTGGEYMSFDRKNRSQIKAKPTAKLIMAWNKKPGFRDSSDGLWRRMILIQFNKKVPDWKKIYGMDDAEWWIKSGEVPGILNWALAGLDRLLRQNGFTQSGAINDAIDEYKNESINSRRFLVNNYIKKDGSRVYTNEMYAHYRKWCESEGESRIVTKEELGKQIRRIFPEVVNDKDSYKTDGVRNRYYSGIMKSDPDDQDSDEDVLTSQDSHF